MSQHYVVFDPATGEIKRTGAISEPKDVDKVVPPDRRGEAALACDGGVFAATHYVKDGAVVIRPQVTIDRKEVPADGKTPVTLSGLPNPAVVLVDGQSRQAVGGSATLVFSQSGVSDVKVLTPFPWQDFDVKVTASSIT